MVCQMVDIAQVVVVLGLVVVMLRQAGPMLIQGLEYPQIYHKVRYALQKYNLRYLVHKRWSWWKANVSMTR